MGLLDNVKKALGREPAQQAPAAAPQPQPAPAPAPPAVIEVSPEDLMAERQGEAAPLLLDCREIWEWQQARIPGSLHIAMNSLPERLGELDRSADIVVVCAHGQRSYLVAAFLSEQGFRARSLSGGLAEWYMAGGEMVGA